MPNPIDLFIKGGLVMWPLLVCSIIAVVILVERVRLYNRSHSNMDVIRQQVGAMVEQGQWKDLKALCDEDGGVAAELIVAATKQSHDADKQVQTLQGTASALAATLRHNLNYLETIVTLAPLLGLLGTVTGMMSTFSVLSIQNGEPFAITGGIGEALIATATGLTVAIIALVIHAYLAQREDRLVSEMEEAASIYMTALVGGDVDEA